MRFDSARLGNGEALFVPDQCVMSNGPVPMLTVDKPDLEENVETGNETLVLMDAIAELQGDKLFNIRYITYIIYYIR